MIKYALQCSNGPEFEAWFGNSQSCDDQLSAALVACVDCGDTAVVKALMAPSITGSGKRGTLSPPVEHESPAPDASTGDAHPEGGKEVAMAGQVREALHMLRRYVEKNADYVGDKFADEARKIHYGETEQRGIYGETTPEEADDLQDEGVPFGSMPWPRDDT
jgi:hypothetical protein